MLENSLLVKTNTQMLVRSNILISKLDSHPWWGPFLVSHIIHYKPSHNHHIKVTEW